MSSSKMDIDNKGNNLIIDEQAQEVIEDFISYVDKPTKPSTEEIFERIEGNEITELIKSLLTRSYGNDFQIESIGISPKESLKPNTGGTPSKRHSTKMAYFSNSDKDKLEVGYIIKNTIFKVYQKNQKINQRCRITTYHGDFAMFNFLCTYKSKQGKKYTYLDFEKNEIDSFFVFSLLATANNITKITIQNYKFIIFTLKILKTLNYEISLPTREALKEKAEKISKLGKENDFVKFLSDLTQARKKRKNATDGSKESNENEQQAKKRRVASPSSSDTQDEKGQDIKQIIADFEDNCLFERLREHNDEKYNRKLFTTIEEACTKKGISDSNKKILKLAKAFMIREGIGTKKDEKSAFNDIQSLHKEGFYQATNSLGVCYHLGLGVDQNYKIAFKYYKESADKDYPLACWNLGLCHKDGLGTKQDNQLAFESFNKSAELGYIKAQVDFGVNLFEGKFDSATYSFSNHDTRKGTWQQQLACKHWKNAANKGNLVAMHNLAKSFLKGLGVELNEGKAIDYFKKPADKGYALSQRELGILFLKKQDTKNAILYLQRAIQNGDAYAMYCLGLHYQQKNSIEKAEKQFEEAAKSTHIDWSFLKTPPQKLQECLKSNLTKIYNNYLKKKVTETNELTSLCYLAYYLETGSLGYNKDVTKALNIYNYAKENGLKYFALGEKTINIQDKIIATKGQEQKTLQGLPQQEPMIQREQMQIIQQKVMQQMMQQKQQEQMMQQKKQPTQAQQQPQQPNASLQGTTALLIVGVTNKLVENHKMEYNKKKQNTNSDDQRKQLSNEQRSRTRLYHDRQEKLFKLTTNKPDLTLSKTQIEQFIKEGFLSKQK